jgi:hypothetical protein
VLIPLWISAGFVIPAFYVRLRICRHADPDHPARAFDGSRALSARLYGLARPGLNSCAMGAPRLTLVLDLTLIPRFGATGAAIASAAAYTTTTAALVCSSGGSRARRGARSARDHGCPREAG